MTEDCALRRERLSNFHVIPSRSIVFLNSSPVLAVPPRASKPRHRGRFAHPLPIPLPQCLRPTAERYLGVLQRNTNLGNQTRHARRKYLGIRRRIVDEHRRSGGSLRATLERR